MKRQELIDLKRKLIEEKDRRNRINRLLRNDFIKEFIRLNKLDIREFQVDENWDILKELLKEFKITGSNGILVCTGNYITNCTINYQETDYYQERIEFGSVYSQYQIFKDIETEDNHLGYIDSFIQREIEEETKYSNKRIPSASEFCKKTHRSYLISELKQKYILLNPNSSNINENGYNDVKKYFFENVIKYGQPKAKQLILLKFPHIN